MHYKAWQVDQAGGEFQAVTLDPPELSRLHIRRVGSGLGQPPHPMGEHSGLGGRQEQLVEGDPEPQQRAGREQASGGQCEADGAIRFHRRQTGQNRLQRRDIPEPADESERADDERDETARAQNWSRQIVDRSGRWRPLGQVCLGHVLVGAPSLRA